jgi:hypothetical protein
LNLEQATLAALAAAERGDLDALGQALAARAEALVRGEAPTPGVHAAGERIRDRLLAFVQEMHLEAARLERFARHLEITPETGLFIDHRG